MKRILKKIYTVPWFIRLGRPLFAMAREPLLEPLSLSLARGYASLVTWVYGARPQHSAQGLAEEWNRLMPTPRDQFPIIRTEGETAYVEIHVACPLRGTGDAHACWRAMAFDRALLKRVGGELVVMSSQSLTGGACCKLAIRKAGHSLDDLEAAHPRWHTSSSATGEV